MMTSSTGSNSQTTFQALAKGFRILEGGDANLVLGVDMTNVAKALEVAMTQGKQILLEVTVKHVDPTA